MNFWNGKNYELVTLNFQECKYNLLYFFDLHSLGPDGIRGKFDLVPIVEGAFEVRCEIRYLTFATLCESWLLRNNSASTETFWNCCY